MKLDSEHLEILAAVVEHGGMTEGAEALGKSQPSVSRTLTLLEKRIGMPLFEPGRRPIRPTELGQRLARMGARISAENRDAFALVESYRRGHAGRLRIGGTPIFMDGVVSMLVAEFQDRNRDISIEQSYGYLDTLLSSLRNEALDLAIVPLRDNQRYVDLNFTPLMPGINVIACRSGHPLTRKKAITISDLSPYSWISPPKESPLFRDLQRTLKSFGQDEIRIGFSGGSFASTISVLMGSDALTVLPASVLLMAPRETNITVLPLRIDHPDRTLGLLTPNGKPSYPALARFSSFLNGQFERLSAKLRHGTRTAQWRG